MELLGRAPELGAIDSLLAGARHEEGGALVLRGDAGVGLSALLDHAAETSQDMWVLRAAGILGEVSVPYGALHRLLAPELWWRHRLHLPEPQRLELARAFGLQPATPGSAPVNDLLVGLGTLMLLARAADEKPVLCVVDDAEQLDEQSAVALALVARRLGVDRIAMLFARREPSETHDFFGDLDEVFVDALVDADARTLIDSVYGHRLDADTRERIRAETAGNPRAIIELPSVLPTASSFVAAEPLPIGPRLQDHFLERFHELSTAAQEAVLLAATLYNGGTALFWSALALLGVDADASTEAESAGLLRIGPFVAISSPLLRSAVYGAATPEALRRVHGAVAGAADAANEPVRAAWHHGAAASEPDEDVAATLVTAASLVRTGGDPATAALLLERASSLTPDPAVHAARLLVAAEDRLAAGSAGRAAALVAETAGFPLSPLDDARALKLRAQVAESLGQGGDSATLLLRAAGEIVALDVTLGRASLLEAVEAAIYVGRFGSGGPVLAASRAALPHSTDTTDDGAELLLHGLALLFTAGHDAAVPTLRRAIETIGSGGDMRWITLAGLAALELWDDRGLEVLVAAEARLGNTPRFAQVRLALAYLAGLDHVIAGRFGKASERYGDTRVLSDVTRDSRIAGIADAGFLIVSAWQGDESHTRPLIERAARDAMVAELGRFYSFSRYALAVLANGLGHYEEASIAAQETVEDRGLYLATFALPELVEAAVRSGDPETAGRALAELSARTIPSGTNWGLGMLARSKALLAKNGRAEPLYQEAIERLVDCRAVPQLARAHLLYGEWLRRQRRRRDAREHLRRAEGMFVAMGAQAFTARARGELEATGEHVLPRDQPLTEALTPQEARIAGLVATGASNAEIGAQLFISPRTVEYHVHKVFGKLGVSSRVELTRLLMAK